MAGPYFGDYRGIVVDVDDPERRNRYRVHVYNVHAFHDDQNVRRLLTWDRLLKMRDGGRSLYDDGSGPFGVVPDEDSSAEEGGSPDAQDAAQKAQDAEERRDPFAAYPWAEVASAPSARQTGDVPYYRIGDLVLIRFEMGNVDHPFITGGWISQRDGIDDLPQERLADYPESRYKWMRLDHGGSLLEQSAMSDETWIRMQSWGSWGQASRADGSYRIVTAGLFDVQSPTVILDTLTTVITGNDILIEAGNAYGYTIGTSSETTDFDGFSQVAPPSPQPAREGDNDNMAVGGIRVEKDQTLQIIPTLAFRSAGDASFCGRRDTWLGIRVDRAHDVERGGKRYWEQARYTRVGGETILVGGATQWGRASGAHVWQGDLVNSPTTSSVMVEAENAITIRTGGITGYGQLGLISQNTFISGSVYMGYLMDFNWVPDIDLNKFVRPEARSPAFPARKAFVSQSRRVTIAPSWVQIGAAGNPFTYDPITKEQLNERSIGQYPTKNVMIDSEDRIFIRQWGSPSTPGGYDPAPPLPDQPQCFSMNGNRELGGSYETGLFFPNPAGINIRGHGGVEICSSLITFCGRPGIFGIIGRNTEDGGEEIGYVTTPCRDKWGDPNYFVRFLQISPEGVASS